MNELGLLRSIRDDELELMLSWRNAPSVRSKMYTRQVISLESHKAWWAGIQGRKDQKYFMYEFSGVPTGIVAFNNIDLMNGNSSWSFYASPEAIEGTGFRMNFLAMEYAFGELGLHRLYGEALDFNTPSVALHKKLGFREEGVKRQHHKMDDGFHDVICFGVLAEDWLKNREVMKLNLLEKVRD